MSTQPSATSAQREDLAEAVVPTSELVGPSAARPYQRDVGTLVIYTARWVVMGRFLESWAEDLRSLGVPVEVVDVDLAGEDADTYGVAVLPTFVFHGSEGTITHTGAITLAALAATCGVRAPSSGRRRKKAVGPEVAGADGEADTSTESTI